MDDKTEKEKLSKYLHVRIGAGICTFVAIVILVLAAVASLDVGAIQPPMPDYDDSTNVYLQAGNLTQEDALALFNTLTAMQSLGYFQFGQYYLVGRTGLTNRLYVASPSGDVQLGETTTITVGDSLITVTGRIMVYDITSSGFHYQSVSNSTLNFSKQNTPLYTDATGAVILNTGYSYGTAHSDYVVANAALWSSFSNKVLLYDRNLLMAENQGYDRGYAEGYDEGLADGAGSGTGGEQVIVNNLDIGSIISALPEGAKAIINGALDWDIFGINVAGTLTAILVVAIVGFVIKWLMTR